MSWHAPFHQRCDAHIFTSSSLPNKLLCQDHKRAVARRDLACYKGSAWKSVQPMPFALRLAFIEELHEALAGYEASLLVQHVHPAVMPSSRHHWICHPSAESAF